MNKFFNLTLVLVACLLVEQARSAQPLEWQFYNVRHSIVDQVSSPEAQDGESLAVVDTSQLNFQVSYTQDSEGRSYRFSRYGYDESQPWGFLYQTFDAKKYINKHLHISTFVKSLEPDLQALESWYAEQYSLMIEAKLAKIDDEFSSAENYQQIKIFNVQELQAQQKQAILDFAVFIRESYENAYFETRVVLHRKTDTDKSVIVEAYAPTSSGLHNSSQLWNRFNIEVGIPEDCYAISVVFESRGLNKLYFDHVALVEHGEKLADRGRVTARSMPQRFVEHIEDKPIINSDGFQNLSFER